MQHWQSFSYWTFFRVGHGSSTQTCIQTCMTRSCPWWKNNYEVGNWVLKLRARRKKQWLVTKCYKNTIEYWEGKCKHSASHSAGEHSQSTGIPHTSIRWILHENIYLHLYKMQITQRLQNGDSEKFKKFNECMLGMIESGSHFVLNRMFTDDTHFNLFGNVLILRLMCAAVDSGLAEHQI